MTLWLHSPYLFLSLCSPSTLSTLLKSGQREVPWAGLPALTRFGESSGQVRNERLQRGEAWILFFLSFLQNGGKHFYLRGALGGASAWAGALCRGLKNGQVCSTAGKAANQSAGAAQQQMASVAVWLFWYVKIKVETICTFTQKQSKCARKANTKVDK